MLQDSAINNVTNSNKIRNWPAKYSLYGWLVSMANGGELAPHIHEKGWLSGGIYINVPSYLDNESGNLVVSLHENLTGANESIDVVTGDLCLFPASLYHHTTPFKSNEARVTLAFDVLPA